ncbi:hypothetical protein MHYP_G00219880 [Metynnis hypsauchen]
MSFLRRVSGLSLRDRVELCPGLAAVGGVLPPEKVKGGVTQEVEERHGVDCWPSSFVCVFVGKSGETVETVCAT